MVYRIDVSAKLAAYVRLMRICKKFVIITPPHPPAPGRGRGIVFERFVFFFVCLFVSLSATLRENGWTDLHEIFREGVE